MEAEGIGAFIRARREEIGLSQRQLAIRVGIPGGYMSQIEAERFTWPRKHIPALARELGVSEVEMAVAAGVISATGTEVQAV